MQKLLGRIDREKAPFQQRLLNKARAQLYLKPASRSLSGKVVLTLVAAN